MMGGRVWLESTLGVGSTFHVNVKVAKQPAADGRSTLSAAPAAGMRSLRILLADDNPINRKLAATLLRQHGHQVVETEDGRAALAAMEQARFDIALLDMQMPEIDGLQAAALIREKERVTGGRLPIVAMTASLPFADQQGCRDAGMDAYLCKPFELAELLKTVNDLTTCAEGSPRCGEAQKR
jgi:CheY-like chemotaxis protein